MVVFPFDLSILADDYGVVGFAGTEEGMLYFRGDASHGKGKGRKDNEDFHARWRLGLGFLFGLGPGVSEAGGPVEDRGAGS